MPDPAWSVSPPGRQLDGQLFLSAAQTPSVRTRFADYGPLTWGVIEPILVPMNTRVRWLLLVALAGLLGPAAPQASGQANPNWVEVRSAHFVVSSNAGETQARQIAEQFEQIRQVFHDSFARLRVDPPQPVVIVAAHDEATMRMWTPDEFEGERHVHPAGVFHSDGEKDYVVMRLDAPGITAFHTVYHEYTHALLHLNFNHVPLWLSEGLAEFFGNSTLGPQGARTGTADKSHLNILGKNEWLSIEALLDVKEDSPYYNEENPASIFYAESWAVVHYLLLDPEARRKQLLNKFLLAWDQSGDQIAAGRQAFGDFGPFGETIRKYVRSRDWNVGVALPARESTVGSYAVRNLSPGEVLTLRGDLMMHRGLLHQAGPLVKQAVELEPRLAAAHTALGFFYFRDSDFAAADEEMSKAIELGSTDFLAFYCHGVLLLRDVSATEEATQKARTSLENAARLNPAYAPTFEALTQAYSRSADTQRKALEAAQTAVNLEPDARTYQFGLAYVLLNNGRAAEAGAVAQKLLASAGSAEDTQAAHRLLDTVEEEQQWQKESEEQDSLDAGRADDAPKTGMASPPDAAPAHAAISRRQLGPPEWMAVDGAITAIDCAHSPEVVMTLSLAKGPLSFHTGDFQRVGVSGVSQKTTPGLDTCKQWTGRRVKVWFRLVQDKDYLGEIIKIYFY
jgi:tetratricopeptide (TPR) repeat protein